MEKHYYWEADTADGTVLIGCGWWQSLGSCLDELTGKGLRDVEAFESRRCTAR